MKKTIGAIILAVLIIPIVTRLVALANNQEEYEEAYVKTTEFLQEQRMANELTRQQMEMFKEDQDRQWLLILQQEEDDDRVPR